MRVRTSVVVEGIIGAVIAGVLLAWISPFISAFFESPPPLPSFNCQQAKTQAEQLICKSPKLAALDVEMNSLYREIQSTSPADRKKTIEDSQTNWLRYVRDRCISTAFIFRAWRSESCMKKSYVDRISELGAKYR